MQKKFRFRDKNTGELCHEYGLPSIYIGYNGDVVHAEDTYEHSYCSPCEDKNLIIEQWTGLKNKNGVDIYEGDLVKYTFYSGKTLKVGMVEWGQYSDHEYVYSLETWVVDKVPLSCLINDAGTGCSFLEYVDENSVEIETESRVII